MTRFLGIDYGTKRIGLAISDEGGTLAFPKEIISNRDDSFKKIEQILQQEGVAEMVVGESLDFAGKENQVMAEVRVFVKELEHKFGLPVHLEKEFLTSVEARRFGKDGEKVDAGAAALILQRFLDKRNQSKKF